MSSMYTSTNLFKYPSNTSFISLWKVGGAFFNPNGITLNSYNPLWHIKAVFSLSSSFISICQYPLAKSKLVNQLPSLNFLSNSSILGNGCTSLFVYHLFFYNLCRTLDYHSS